jgi:hypothetical protein
MPNTAATIGDSIGHIMNYGDGWYGGVYVGAMYSLAFVSNDIQYIVKEGLKTVPAQSTFHQCISDVIKWHSQYPNDWRQNWFEIQKRWSSEVGCPDGVFSAFNIDAKLNAAYIVLGLLYGNGDFSKTMDISTRAGQDSDCNPSSAGGILGTMLGYEKIPAYWKQGLREAEDIDFKYTTVSLNDAYELSLKHAIEVIKMNGGKVEADQITLPVQKPSPVRLEQSFPAHYPVEKRGIHKDLASTIDLEFEGKGFVLTGEANPKNGSNWDYSGSFVFDVELTIDGKTEKIKCPVVFSQRRYDLFWKYNLNNGKHKVAIKVLNPDSGYVLRVNDLIVYAEKSR